jgi:hypothetical protein
VESVVGAAVEFGSAPVELGSVIMARKIGKKLGYVGRRRECVGVGQCGRGPQKGVQIPPWCLVAQCPRGGR